MKKLFLLLTASSILITGCTDNYKARHMGGTMTINLPAHQKLIDVTWKDKDGGIWYLTRPMHSNEVAETYTWKEKSPLGRIEGTVLFVETK